MRRGELPCEEDVAPTIRPKYSHLESNEVKRLWWEAYGPYIVLLHYMAMNKDHEDGQTLRSLLGRTRAVATNFPFNFDGLLAMAEAILEDLTLGATQPQRSQ